MPFIQIILKLHLYLLTFFIVEICRLYNIDETQFRFCFYYSAIQNQFLTFDKLIQVQVSSCQH